MYLINQLVKPIHALGTMALYLLLVSSYLHAQEMDWPRDLELDSGVLTIYQPQADDMEKDILRFRAAGACLGWP